MSSYSRHIASSPGGPASKPTAWSRTGGTCVRVFARACLRELA